MKDSRFCLNKAGNRQTNGLLEESTETQVTEISVNMVW